MKNDILSQFGCPFRTSPRFARGYPSSRVLFLCIFSFWATRPWSFTPPAGLYPEATGTRSPACPALVVPVPVCNSVVGGCELAVEGWCKRTSQATTPTRISVVGALTSVARRDKPDARGHFLPSARPRSRSGFEQDLFRPRTGFEPGTLVASIERRTTRLPQGPSGLPHRHEVGGQWVGDLFRG